jgi:hypothetical protein
MRESWQMIRTSRRENAARAIPITLARSPSTTTTTPSKGAGEWDASGML